MQKAAGLNQLELGSQLYKAFPFSYTALYATPQPFKRWSTVMILSFKPAFPGLCCLLQSIVTIPKLLLTKFSKSSTSLGTTWQLTSQISILFQKKLHSLTQTHTHTHTYIHTYTHTHTHTHIHTNTHTHTTLKNSLSLFVF